MPSKGRAEIQIINKNGTPVEVTDDNRLKVETIIATNAAVRTPTLLRTSLASSVAAGARSVSFFNSGSTDTPTIDGIVLKQGETVSFNAGGEDDTLAAIDYSGAGGELLIAIIV